MQDVTKNHAQTKLVHISQIPDPNLNGTIMKIKTL